MSEYSKRPKNFSNSRDSQNGTKIWSMPKTVEMVESVKTYQTSTAPEIVKLDLKRVKKLAEIVKNWAKLSSQSKLLSTVLIINCVQDIQAARTETARLGAPTQALGWIACSFLLVYFRNGWKVLKKLGLLGDARAKKGKKLWRIEKKTQNSFGFPSLYLKIKIHTIWSISYLHSVKFISKYSSKVSKNLPCICLNSEISLLAHRKYVNKFSFV